MESINIQSISDLITNSSTEAFVVYDVENIKSIKELVNSILSLLDTSKTFDDYFTIEMEVNYDDLRSIFLELCDDENLYESWPELKTFNSLDSYAEQDNFLELLSIDTIEDYFNYYNEDSYDCRHYPYEGFIISAKVDDPVVQKVARVINNVDQIFDVDYSNNW